MRHVICYDAALAAVRKLTDADPESEIAIDDIAAAIREAGLEWPRETIIKVVNRDLAGIGSGKNAPRTSRSSSVYRARGSRWGDRARTDGAALRISTALPRFTRLAADALPIRSRSSALTMWPC